MQNRIALEKAIRRYGEPVVVYQNGHMTLRTTALVNVAHSVDAANRRKYGSSKRTSAGTDKQNALVLYMPYNTTIDSDDIEHLRLYLRGDMYVVSASAVIPLGMENLYLWVMCKPFTAAHNDYNDLDLWGDDDDP